MSNVELRVAAAHTPEEVWQGLNTPLLDEAVASRVYEDITVSYDRLGPEQRVQVGTAITFTPQLAAIKRILPRMFRGLASQGLGIDLGWRVDKLDEKAMARREVLESARGNQGMINQRVEVDGGTAFLVVEADLTLAIIGNMEDTEDKLLAEGVVKPAHRFVGFLPEILASA